MIAARRAGSLWLRTCGRSSSTLLCTRSGLALPRQHSSAWSAHCRYNSSQATPDAPSSSSLASSPSTTSPCQDMIKSYTLRVEGTVVDDKVKNLTVTDVHKLFGAFEPYNIILIPPPEDPKKYFAVEKGQRPIKTFPLATFQVPSLGYAQEIVKSFHHDETWGERITVAFEQESYPVFLCNLPSGATAPELKAALNAARKKIPKKIKNKDQDAKHKATDKMFMSKTPISVYDSYAVLRCPSKFASLSLLQGVFQFKDAPASAGGGKGGQNTESVPAAAAIDIEDQGEGGDDEDDFIVASYAAWKTFPVRVNGLPMDVTAKDVEKAFAKYLPYDVEILPAADAGDQSRSAYVRFARLEQASECSKEMNDTTLKNKDIKVRPAWEKLFPVVVKGRAENAVELAKIVASLRQKGLDVVDADVIDAEKKDVVIRFASSNAYTRGIKALKQQSSTDSERGNVEPAYKPFKVELANLPYDLKESELKELVNLSSPYEVYIERGPADKPCKGHVAFFASPDAEAAYHQLQACGIPHLKMRKSWAVYRLKVKGLPLSTTEADLREVLKGYEPFRVDFPLSRKGNLKGEAVLRFSAYDELVAAVSRLYGRDSPMDEAYNRGRWKSAGVGLIEEDDIIEASSSITPEVFYALSSEEERGQGGKGRLRVGKGQQLKAMVDQVVEEDIEGAELVDRVVGDILDKEEGEIEEEDDDEAEWLEGEKDEEIDQAGYEMQDMEEGEEQMDEELFKRQGNPFGIYPEGRWVKMLIDTDTTQKIVKGGQILSYRVLMIVGNLNGAGGWGIGKGANMEEAKIRAIRAAKKNLIHIDLYRNRCVTTPLYGKHNNCRIYIQAGNPRFPHREGRMINDMIRIMGIECGEARSVGKRNPYSVVRAMFDALSKHQGVEEVSRRRGRRLISVSRARYLGL